MIIRLPNIQISVNQISLFGLMGGKVHLENQKILQLSLDDKAAKRTDVTAQSNRSKLVYSPL